MNWKRRSLLVLLAVALLVGAVPAGAASSPGNATITTVDVRGEQIRDEHPEGLHLWKSESISTNVSVTTNKSSQYDVCLQVKQENASTSELDCQSVDLKEGTETTVQLGASSFPNSSSGTVNLSVVVVDVISHDTLDEKQIPVHVLRKTADEDGDGLTNVEEARRGTNLSKVDTDEDGLEDGPEVHNYGTDPTRADSDQDGLRDQQEVSMGTNATVADTDGDGLLDGREVELGTDPTEAHADADGDGLIDSREVELGTDPTEADTDSDMLSDRTEVRLGTDPRDPMTVVKIAGPLLAGVLAVALLYRSGWLSTGAQSGESETSAAAALGSGHATNGENGSGRRDRVPPEDVSDELLTNEDRIFRILDEYDGRVQQRQIVEETDWSKSKVSRVLSKMDDEGQITKINIGRENVITRAGDEPDGAKSPFEK